MIATLWLAIKSLWTKALPMLSPYATAAIKWGAIGVTVLGVLAGYKRAGKVAEQAEQLEQEAKNARKAQQVEAAVSRLPDGSALNKLRSDWSRSV